MTFVRNGYLVRRSRGTGNKRKFKPTTSIKHDKVRDWWLIKNHWNGNGRFYGQVMLGPVSLPEEYIGKRIRFKIEILGDEQKGDEK